MNQELVRFLVDYGHLLLRFEHKDTIDDALISIVSSAVSANKFYNNYNMDIYELYWEWMLLPRDGYTYKRITQIVKLKALVSKLYK